MKVRFCLQKIAGFRQHIIKPLLHISRNSGTSKYQIKNKAKYRQAQNQHGPGQFIRGIDLSVYNHQNHKNTDCIQRDRHISGIACKAEKDGQQPAKLYCHRKYHIKNPVKQKLGNFLQNHHKSFFPSFKNP